MSETLEINPEDLPQAAWLGIEPGAVLGERYRLERPINRGGMGAVFEATQLGLDRKVAVKVLLPEFSRDARMQERFRREARSAASLRHPNIIQIHDYGISQYGSYIVMELVRGSSLRDLLRGGALETERALRVMDQVCSAVGAAHNAGVIHRDLKPDNILIDEHTSGLTLVKVLDFGIAKLREAQTEGAELSLTGSNLIGSPHYMSPEQCLGLELDVRSDIYSLGVILYEMLAGRVPFSGANSGAVILQHTTAAPARLREMRPDLPAAVESVVMKALAKDRDLRHGDAAELARELRLALEEPGTFEEQRDSTPTLGLNTTYATKIASETTAAPEQTKGQTRRRLAILPLRNLTGEADIEFLGFALADSVIMQLACIKSLIVRPSSAIERYRNQVADPQTVGRELQVDTILSGSYLKAGDMFRVSVQLIDAERNEIIWQERIDLKFADVISLQDRICEELIRGLRLNLSTGEQEALKRDAAPNPVAYELYLRGLACPKTVEGNKQAIEFLESAVKLDQSYAPAWAALAYRYLNVRHMLHDETMLQKIEDAVQKALTINPQLPAALFALVVYYAERRDVVNAMATSRRLLQVAPNSEYAYQAMGHAYDYAGQTDIALTLFRKAAEINPVAFPFMVGLLYLQKGDLVEARRALEAAQPGNYPYVNYWLAVLDYLEGRKDEALARLEGELQVETPGLILALAYGLRCAIAGEPEDGKRVIRQIVDAGGQLGGYGSYFLAQICAQVGDFPTCLALLREAIKAGYGNYPWLMSDPLIAPVRSVEGFAEVAAEMMKLQTQMQLMLVAS
jgi:eukaryotic-like serine/threonine-protein kinase